MSHHENSNRPSALPIHFERNRNSAIKRKSPYPLIQGISLAIVLLLIAACGKESEMDQFLEASPPVLTVVQVENGIKLSWSEVKGTDNYIMQKSGCKDFSSCLNNILSLNRETFFIDENPLDGMNYYKIYALKFTSKGKRENTGFSNVVSISYEKPNETASAE